MEMLKTNFNIYLIIKNMLEEKGGHIYHDTFTHWIYLRGFTVG